MAHSLRIALFLIMLFATNLLVAQTYYYKEFSLEQGLPQSEVMDAHLSSNGNLWLGLNMGGLCLLDGEKVKVFSAANGQTIGTITSIREDGVGNIWLYSFTEGLMVFDGKEFNAVVDTGNTFAQIRPSLMLGPDSTMMAIGYDRNAQQLRLFNYVAASKSFYPVQIDSFPPLNVLNGSNNIGMLDKQNRMWWGASDGLYLYNSGKFTRHPLSGHEKLKGKQISPIYTNPYTGDVWLTARDSKNHVEIYIYDQKEVLTEFLLPEGYRNAPIVQHIIDRKGNIWLWVAQQGIWRYDGQHIQKFTTANGLPSTNINELFEDAEGGVWIATRGSGIIKMPDEKFLNFHVDDDYDVAITDQFYEDSKGNIWIGTWQQGYSMYDGEKLHSYHTNGDLPRILDFAELPNGEMLISLGNLGNNNPNIPRIARINQGKLTDVTTKLGIPSNINASDVLMQRGNKELWVGTRGRGVFVYDFGKEAVTRQFNTQNGLTHNSIFAMDTFADGRAIIASFGGVDIQVADTVFENYLASEHFEETFCLQLAVDKAQNVWFATYAKGVFRYKDGKIKSLKDDERVPTIIYSVVADDNGNIWLGGQNGVYCLVLDEEGNILEVKHYTKKDGFLGTETNGGGAMKDSKGRLWFGHLDGVAVYDPSKDIPSQTAPETKIQAVNFNLEKTNWKDSVNLTYYSSLSEWYMLPQDLVLPPKKNSLSFEFGTSSQQDIHKIKYQWRLLPIEADWQIATDKQEAAYPNLGGGDYIFEVRAQSASGVWGAPASYSFSVRPPFTETIGFRLGAVLLISMVTFVGFRMRIRSMEAQRKRLEGLVKLRTKEIVEQNHEIMEKNVELEQQKEEIASQRDLLESQFSDIERKRQIMQDALKEIEEQNVNIQASINYAQRIQEAMLPAMHEIQRDLPDIFVFFRPRDVVSGDFYWSTKVGDKTIIAAVDCTGHGVPGAFMAMSGNAYLQQIVNTQGITDPGQILNELHRLVTTSLRQGQTLNRDGMDAAICTVDWEHKKLYFAGAKNPLLYKLPEEDTLTKIKGDRYSIGGQQEYKRCYETHEIPLASGMCCYIHSDGFQDQFGGPDGRKFMSKRFKDKLNELSNKPMLQQGQLLEDCFDDWIGEESQIDDVLVIGFRVLL